MNHLCGLEGITFLSDISDDDAIMLKSFRNKYNSHKSHNDQNHNQPMWIVPNNVVMNWRPLDDMTLYRFLRADVEKEIFRPEKSLDRILRAMEFRHKNEVDALLKAMTIQKEKKKRQVSLISGNWSQSGSIIHTTQQNKYANDILTCLPDLEKYQRLRVRVFTGRGHNGEPILFERLGDFLGSGNHVHFSEEEWVRFYIWDLERHFMEMREAARLTGKPISTYVFCGDCHGMVSAILSGKIRGVIPLLKTLAKSVEEFYPEIAARIILFRVPRVGAWFYRAVRAFLDPVTASKIHLHSGVPTDEFLKWMPREAIPSEYGGSCHLPYPPTATR
eukprot:CAMPEP_0178911004 /NCGR_PEP_ID=MMETSP0786-20121207/9428_1 /TAXON_ID=186022 /ORGANISM="Thalassionema frauenfeldii, Strain CCMP 1798" /LENGTH=331 /DNA_ID=CAMNT_0020583351 /DNA_START=127 /DNA_END=1122 /DNA_ORIENTATION=-